MTQFDADLNLQNLIKKARGLVFDFDGVIADTEQLHAQSYVTLLSAYGIEFDPESFSDYIGNSDSEILSRMQEEFGITIDIEKMREERNECFLELAEEKDLLPNERIVKIIKDASSGNIPAVILSSQNRRVINTLLNKWSLSEYFSNIYTAAEMNTTKNDLLPRLEDFLGISFSEMVIFEDSAATLAATEKFGIKTVGVLHSLNKESHIKADVII